MKTKIQALIKRISTAAKTYIRTMSRIVKPTPGEIPTNCVNINALLMHLSGFDPRTYRYTLKWLAYPVQFPGAKMGTALIINGPEGTGSKLFFERIVGGMYRNSSRHILASRLDSGVTDWASGARFVTIEGRVSRLAGLKALITSDTVAISGKYDEADDNIEPNRMNFVFISQSQAFLPPTAGDRRFMVIEAPPPRDAVFYQAVEEEIKNGGVDAFRTYLLTSVFTGDFNPSSAPPKAVKAAFPEFA
jgi:putative DNA primase/helicase